MKLLKTLVVTAVLVMSGLSASAQIQWKAGAGFAFGTEAETIGLRLQGDAQFTEQWEALAEFIIYFKSDITYWEFNLNGHYDFAITDEITVYPMAGLNFSHIGYNIQGFGVGSTEIGLNIGGGGEYDFTDNIAGFLEIKYIISSFDQLVISLGALYSF